MTTRLPSSPAAAAAWSSYRLAAQAGADVLTLFSRTSSELDAVAEQIRAAGRRAHTVAADLAHPEVVRAAGWSGRRSWEARHVVNNVGGTMPNTPRYLTATRGTFLALTGTAHALTVAAVLMRNSAAAAYQHAPPYGAGVSAAWHARRRTGSLQFRLES